MNMAGNREGVRLCVEMTLVVMDKSKRWFNNFFFAPFDANLMRPELVSEGSLVIAEDEDDFCIMRLPNLLAKHRKLIEHVLCASRTSMKQIACDKKSAGIVCLYDGGESLKVALC
tara:strand:+ start:569 stop:913 length:345 start_codon:yes stop_codon:yes gene_type:complete